MLNGFSTKCKRDQQTNPSDLVNYTFETKLLGSHVLFFPPCLKFRQEKLGQSDNVLLQTPSYKVQTTRTEINWGRLLLSIFPIPKLCKGKHDIKEKSGLDELFCRANNPMLLRNQHVWTPNTEKSSECSTLLTNISFFIHLGAEQNYTNLLKDRYRNNALDVYESRVWTQLKWMTTKKLSMLLRKHENRMMKAKSYRVISGKNGCFLEKKNLSLGFYTE